MRIGSPEEYALSDISALLKFEEIDGNGDGLLSERELEFRFSGNAQSDRRRGGRQKGEGGSRRSRQ